MRRVDELPVPPTRPDDGHKGTFGRVLIIAGSRGMSGAACLAGTSALRCGSGLVYVATPAEIVPIVAGYEPSYLTVPLADEEGRVAGSALETVLARSAGMDAVAIGPGLGQSSGLKLLVSELYHCLDVPVVVDADGLNLLSRSSGSLSDHSGPRVLTPHVGEFARLTGMSIGEIAADRQSCAARFSAEHDVTLVLKGPGTLVTDPQRVAVNTTGNAGLGTGGTGDVLTGVITSLLGQGLSPFDAAHLGAHLHGLAGDLAAARLGQRSMMASDLLEFLPDAWLAIEAESL